MKLAVAFLCYNQSSAPYLPDFLSSLDAALEAAGTEVFVLAGDNSDQPPYVNNLLIDGHNRQSSFPARLFSFEKNLGFAAAYNRLIAAAVSEKCDYFLMLNPDMLIDREMIRELMAALADNNQLAVVCPKIYRWDFSAKQKTKILDSCGIILKSGLRFSDLGQGKEDDGRYDRSEIFGPSGAAACFRVKALKKIRIKGQYFDERFFMYKEDCDLAYRLHLAGLKTKLVPTAIAYHDRSAASKGGFLKTWQAWQRRSPLTRSWSFVNQHFLFAKYWPEESLKSKGLIIVQLLFLRVFSLIFAPFLLKSYIQIKSLIKSLK